MNLKSVNLEVSFMSVIGNKRLHNEDNLFVNGYFLNQRDTHTSSENVYFNDAFHLFSVFDGVGGASAGDLASNIAAKGHEYIYHFFKNKKSNDEVHQIYNSYIDVINERIIKEKKKRFADQMGTTLATLVFKEGRVYPFFLGDSRIYRYRQGRLDQLSVDHTETAMLVRLGILTEEASKSHPSFGKLRQFLGKEDGESQLEADSYVAFEHLPGDYYLLCSDGLSNYLDYGELKSYLESGSSSCWVLDQLFNSVLGKKSDDNITGILIKVI